jgi:hypothetical protein
MKRLLLILATLALATSAMAMIGQTPDEIIGDAQRNQAAKIQNGDFGGLREIYVDYKDGSSIRHTFGLSGREIAFSVTAYKRFPDNYVAQMQRAYRSAWQRRPEGIGVQWVSASGLQMIFDHSEAGSDRLAIFDMNNSDEIKKVLSANKVSVLTETNVYPPATDTAEYPPQQQPYVAPPTPAPVPQSTPNIASDDKDCLIKAAEKVTELRHGGYWAMILRFDQTKDGQKLEWGGHAVVVFQLKAGQTLFYWDKDLGSISLGTTSRELEAIAPALNGLYHALTGSHFGVQGVEWIDS